MTATCGETTERVVDARTHRSKLDGPDCEECGQSRKLKVGTVKALGQNVDFTNISANARFRAPQLQSKGMMQEMSDGGYVWTTAIEGIDATALRVHFTEVSLPDNAGVNTQTKRKVPSVARKIWASCLSST